MQTLNLQQDNRILYSFQNYLTAEPFPMGHDTGLEFIQEFWKMSRTGLEAPPLPSLETWASSFHLQKMGQTWWILSGMEQVKWDHTQAPYPFFSFSSLPITPLLPSLLSSNTPIFSPQGASSCSRQLPDWAPLRTVQRVQMSGSACLKAISFVELCGLFFPPETGSAWAQHLGDKLDLI